MILKLAVKSLWHRKVIMGLSLLSITLSVALLVGVERIREGVKESFSGTISQTDLIVGAPGGPLQLLLFAVFGIGQGIGQITYDTFSAYRSHEDVEWAIPFSLGDSFRGSRVVGTTPDFFKFYRHHGDKGVEFEKGRSFQGMLEVVLGADVAAKNNLNLGQDVQLSHGLAQEGSLSLVNHDNLSFKIVGILQPTATPIDRSVYVSLEAIEAMHVGWEDGAPPVPGEEIPESEIEAHELEPQYISGFFLRAQSRIKVLALQREISESPEEPLMAIIPGVALAELWKNFTLFEKALRLISIFVMGVALTSMFVAIYSSLQVRRREMAILRSLGAGFSQVAALFVAEATAICIAAAALGLGAVYAILVLGQKFLFNTFGIFIALTPPGLTEALALGALVVLGSVVGFVPALKAYRTALSDGLSVRL